MRLSFETFGGIVPRLAPELLQGNQAQTARNCKLSNGLLRPWFNDSQEATLVNTGTIRTIYRHAGAYWFEWEADVDVVPGPISADTTGRLYYTGHGIPKKTNTSLATTGSGAKPVKFYPLAVPYGWAAPTGSVGSGGTGEPRNTVYVYTCVTTWGEEGSPSPASEVVQAMNGQAVSLSGMSLKWLPGQAYVVGDFVYPASLPVLDFEGNEVEDFEGNPVRGFAGAGAGYIFKCVTAGTSGATEPDWTTTQDADTTDGSVIWRCYENFLSSKRVYRLNTGNTSAQYERVGTIDVEETTLNDTVTDADLGAALVTADYDQPPDGLTGLCYLGNGIMLGFSGKDLYVSEPYLPYAWPTGYSRALAFSIVGMETMGGIAVIITEGNPYLVTGSDPAGLSVLPMPDPHAGVSKRGCAACPLGVIYPSPAGLVLVKPDGSSGLFTQQLYTVDEWSLIYPGTLHGHIHDNRYFGLYSYGDTEGGIVLDLQSGELTTLEMYCDAAWVDPEEDAMYFVKDAAAVEDLDGWNVTDFEGNPIEEPT